MAFWQIITASLAAYLLISTPVRADECVSIDKFHYTLSSQGVTPYGSRAAATVKLEAVLNENRARAGNPAIKASIFLVGYVKDPSGSTFALVSVVGTDGCIIEDTFVTLTAEMWVGFLMSAGVRVEDFFPIDGA